MTNNHSKIISNILATATLLIASTVSQHAFGESNRLCAIGESSNCYLSGNFPPSVASQFNVIGDEALTIRFIDGSWSIGGHTLGNFSGPQWIPVVGDWDGDGYDNIGVYRNGTWVLKMSWDFSPTSYDVNVRLYGDPTWTPIVGDWNGDSKDTVGLYKDGVFKLLPDHDDPASEVTIDFDDSRDPGNTNKGPLPFAGAFGGAADKVGIFYVDGAYYATENVSAFYDRDLIHPELEYAVVQLFSQDKFPIVANLAKADADDLPEGEILIFSRRPATGDYSTCLSPTNCRWIDTSDPRPEDGGRTDIPQPTPF